MIGGGGRMEEEEARDTESKTRTPHKVVGKNTNAYTYTYCSSVCPSVRLSICPSVRPSVCLYIYLYGSVCFFVCLQACSMHASKNISTHYICDKGNKHVHSITQINQIINLLKDSLMILETDPHDCTNSQHVSSKQFNCCCLTG